MFQLRRALLALSVPVFAGALLVGATSAWGAQEEPLPVPDDAALVTETTTPKTPDLDCADFASQADAQAELAKDRSDPHGLDGNDNDIACESHFGMPTQPPAAQPETSPPPPAVHTPQDKDCADFAPGQAQAELDANPADPHGLDADNDGLACESSAGSGQVSVHPVGGVATGGH